MPTVPKSEVKERIPKTEQEIRDIILSGGDISSLTTAERGEFLAALCKEIGVNPMLKPFDFIPGQGGKLLLYANKSLAAQLREKYEISVEKISSGPLEIGPEIVSDIYTVEVKATMGTRTQVEIGASFIGGLKGADLANRIMATYTKAIRRVTLSIKGIGIPDESELEDTPAFAKAFEQKSKMKVLAVETPKISLDKGPEEADLVGVLVGQANRALIGE